MFYVQPSDIFPKMQATPVWLMLVVMVIGMTLIPVGAALDIRGWSEMHPLDGPAWSLFYEYVANIFYALFVRKFSKLMLGICVVITGGILLHYCVTGPGDVIGGWSLEPAQVRIGVTRLLYPFFAGLLLSRVVKVGKIKHAFLLSSAIIIAALAMPRFGGEHDLWMNGLYESLCIIIVFPLVVYLGASGDVESATSSRVCTFLGAISYPLYIVHYPFVYIYTAWVVKHRIPLNEALPITAATWLFCVALAWIVLKFYDIPVRQWLGRRYLRKANRPALTPAPATSV